MTSSVLYLFRIYLPNVGPMIVDTIDSITNIENVLRSIKFRLLPISATANIRLTLAECSNPSSNASLNLKPKNIDVINTLNTLDEIAIAIT